MRRSTHMIVLAALVATGSAIAAGLAPGTEARPDAAEAVSRVTVTASEFKYVLSRSSVPTGKVVFTVVNKGKITHDFKIAGKKTAKIAPGKSARLTVTFARKGSYGFLCTLAGHATAGMKGTLSVTGASAAAPTPAPAPTPTPAPTPPPATGTVGSARSTVNVSMTDFKFAFSPASVPSGQVTFVIANNGSELHNVDIPGVKAGAILAPGKSETWTVGLPAKTYSVVCDVPFHIDRGMLAPFTVTP
jgi:uncharacterized cupredoxin-like copper-binding protein